MGVLYFAAFIEDSFVIKIIRDWTNGKFISMNVIPTIVH